MERYHVTCSNRPRGFHVRGTDGVLLAELRHPKWYSQDMEGHSGQHALRITSEGFWRSRYAVFLDGARIGTISTKPWGQLGITLAGQGTAPVEVELAAAGPWRQRYHLRITKEHPLLEVRAAFQWSSFTTDLEVSVLNPGITAEQMPLLLAITAFGVRLKRARAAAHTGAGV